jgi:hypothetical protein
MKANPKMKILVAGGYFDVAPPFSEGVYEMRHLPVPQELQANISYRYYEWGIWFVCTRACSSNFGAAAFVKRTTTH